MKSIIQTLGFSSKEKLSNNTNDDHLIPRLSSQDLSKLFNASNFTSPLTCYYSLERSERHMLSQRFLHALYDVGAVLINQGAAYQDKNLLNVHDEQLQLQTNSNSEKNQELLNFYHDFVRKLPAGYPYAALLVMKVALDHLPPEWILKNLSFLIKNNMLMTINKNEVAFPNGSKFVNDHAVTAVLGRYILANPDKFNLLFANAAIHSRERSIFGQQPLITLDELKINIALNSHSIAPCHMKLDENFMRDALKAGNPLATAHRHTQDLASSNKITEIEERNDVIIPYKKR